MAKNTRELIIKALITLAKKNPQRSSFTMTEIAAEAGISRQAIYQKHFNNFEDIIEYIHEETNQDIFNVFNKYCPSVKMIQHHLKSLERLLFNCLKLLCVTILCPKKRILSCTQDSFYCCPLKASTIT